MWARYLIKVQKAVASGRLKTNDDIADFVSKEYDKVVKTGGDLFYKVNVINGNRNAMRIALRNVLDKNSKKSGENINIKQDLPTIFDAYWFGCEFSPIPNPLLKPQGWAGTVSIDIPSCVILSPDITATAKSAVKNKVKVELFKAIIDSLKSKEVTIVLPQSFRDEYTQQTGKSLPTEVTIKVYDAAMALLQKKKPLPNEAKELNEFLETNPVIKSIKDAIRKFQELKSKKPSAGAQHKKSIKVKIPIPDRKALIKKAVDELVNRFTERVQQLIREYLEKSIILNLIKEIENAIKNAKQKPNPIPSRERLREYIQNTLKNIKDDIEGVEITGIPTKEIFEEIIKSSIPDEKKLRIQAESAVKNLVPEPPYIEIIKPDIAFINHKKLLWGTPFVQEANKYHFNIQGIVQVLTQCGGPISPVTPNIIKIQGYKVKTGPPVPPIPSGIKIPDVQLSPLPNLNNTPSFTEVLTSFVKNIPVPNVEKPTVKIKAK